MSHNHNDEHEESHKTPRRKEMSRRQFLTYTLGGATAYMAAGAVLPMLRFAVDPVLQEKGEGAFVKVVEESKITNEPLEVDFEVKQQDGWYKSTAKLKAWIRKTDDGKILALSPICKHLGCLVHWNTDKAHPNQYFCPCHQARYTPDGKNLVVAPKPLDMYTVKVDKGWIYLGEIVPNTVAK